MTLPPFSERCLTLIDRVLARKISLAASMPVLSDALHKVMMAEVAVITQRDRPGLVGYLRKHPEIIAQLKQYPRAMDRLKGIPMSVLPIDVELLHAGASLATRLGLLTNDAVIVALMQREGLTHLVTNDDDFDQVPGITIWKPR